MLDKEWWKAFLQMVDTTWIRPEIKYRKENDPEFKDLKIARCIIKFPKEHPPIVEFNEEISWRASIKIPPNTSITKGEMIQLHQVQGINYVDPPEFDGERVSFIYIYWTGFNYQCAFDFTPNLPAEMITEDEKNSWSFGNFIAESLQLGLFEKTLYIHEITQTHLDSIGLWPAPAIIPYPLSKIIFELNNGNIEEAIKILNQHCTPQFIEEFCSKWWDNEQFKSREFLIHEAFDAHKEGKYILSIYSLLPQVEGIITDYILTKNDDIPWRQESKTKKFQDIVLYDLSNSYTYERIVKSGIEFILKGPVLETFTDWFQPINTTFPNRHAIGHGKYDPDFFTELNSIKLFLLLDTIYYIVSEKK